MRDTDDTFDGNFVQPVRLHNLLMLTVRQERIFWTTKKHSLSYKASTTCWFVSRGLKFQKILVQTGSDCVFSDPIEPLRLCYYASVHDECPCKTRQPNLHLTWWMHDVTRINNIKYTHISYICYTLNAAPPSVTVNKIGLLLSTTPKPAQENATESHNQQQPSIQHESSWTKAQHEVDLSGLHFWSTISKKTIHRLRSFPSAKNTSVTRCYFSEMDH